MQTTFFFKNMNPVEQRQLQDYFWSKLPKLERITDRRFPSDSAILEVKGERFEKHSAYHVDLILKLPFETLMATEASHTINKAIDLATDRLNMQLKRTVMHMREGHRSLRARTKLNLRAAAGKR